jgi:hypothetical protein
MKLNISPVFCPVLVLFCLSTPTLSAQHTLDMRLVKVKNENRVDVFAGQFPFTSFLYPDSLEKPVLFPIYDADQALITRGFPMSPRAGEPVDHPHHTGLWFTYENVNGIDFWNNSYAIAAEKKSLYGWIKTDRLMEVSSGSPAVLRYHANWVNQQNQVLMEETTRFEFSGNDSERIIDRLTVLKADTAIFLEDAKDGLLGLRLTHELQIPATGSQLFKDNKGNVTRVLADSMANGNYLTSEGKLGDSVWSTRASWCKVFGKIGRDSVSITIFDDPANPNYPTFWHARGYGLFAANPLGEKIFTNGKSSFNLKIRKGESVRFHYRILIQNGKTTPQTAELNQFAIK